MKTILPVLTWFLALSSMQAQQNGQAPPPSIATVDYNLPKSNLRELLEITAKIARKPVVVTDPEVLKIQSSLVLRAPIAFEDVRKVIAGLLMLEGYELVEDGEELHLRRFLTEAQVESVNHTLGRVRPGVPERETRGRVIPGARAEKQWILVRPEKVNESDDGEGKK